MRLYRALLHLYPASFRREYGAELAATFARRVARSPGLVAALGVLAGAIADTMVNASSLHWELLRQDLRYAARTLARSPGFALTAVLVTALGIGATTAAFSVTHFVFLRPLPYAEPDRLVTLYQRLPDYATFELSPPNYRDWKAMTRSFSSMGAFHPLEVNFVSGAEPQRLTGAAVTSEVLPLLGVGPQIGRLFTASEEQQGVANGIILSAGLWQRGFGGDRAVLGRTVRLDGTPYVVIGVMPPSFSYPTREIAFWTLMPPDERLNPERDNYWFTVVARLAPGVTLEAARADLSVVAARLARAYPAVNDKIGAVALPLRADISNQSRTMLLALCGASLSVLLIACANLANLLIARSFGRRRELEVRAALGAGRERLVRQLVTESLVVALAGGTLGIAVAWAAVPLLTRLIPMSLPVPDTPSVNLEALAVAAVLTLVTGIGFGVMPALRSSAGTDFSALREGVRGGGLRGMRIRSVLVVAEVMASVVLLVWAGLLIRALHRVDTTDPGFRSEGVVTFRTALPRPKYDSVVARTQFFDEVLTHVRSLPGVSHAGYVSYLPMTMGGGIFPLALPGEPEAMHTGKVASMRYATPGYFAALGIPVVRGRDVSDTDTTDRPNVAVVSQSLAARYWPGQDPIGRRFTFAYGERTIVGVVGDVRVRGLERRSEPQVYLPYRQVSDGAFPSFVPKDLAIRSSRPIEELAPEVRRIVSAADPEQPVSNVRPMAAIVAGQTLSRTVQLRVLGAFAAVALVLAAVGIHGLLAFTVSQRRHEIGVRLALGAEPRAIVGGIVAHSARLAVAGLVPGILLAYAGGRAMESLLAGVTPADAVSFGAASALCALMTVAGSVVPALRSVRVSPAIVFRAE